jgi:hypothetical protein
MACRRVCLPEYDLTLQLVSGVHTGEEAVQFYAALDSSCATRWLTYFDPTSDFSQVNVASVPVIKRVYGDKRQELFGDAPKAHALACCSDSSRQYFFDFWKPYFGLGDESIMHLCRSLEEAYDWLGLCDDARAAVIHAVERFEAGRDGVGCYEVPLVSGGAEIGARFHRRD